MSPPALYTPYPYVNEALQMLLENVRSVLGINFYGLYLHGSLAAGDFDPGHSDIDFLVVTEKEIPESIFPELEVMHRRVWDSGVEWAVKLEGTYLPKDSLYKYNAGDPLRPGINEGKFYVFRHKPEWVINRYILREYGIAVAGPDIRPLIAPVPPRKIRRAVADGVIQAWTPRQDDRNWFTHPSYQPYIAITCCRALYALKTGKIKSKIYCARWALKTFDAGWHGLIRQAMDWHYGLPGGDTEKTLELVKYTLKQMEEYRG